MPRLLIVTPTVYTHLVDFTWKITYRPTQLRIFKPSYKHSRCSLEFPNQNLRQNSPGVRELWSGHTNKRTDKPRLQLYKYRSSCRCSGGGGDLDLPAPRACQEHYSSIQISEVRGQFIGCLINTAALPIKFYFKFFHCYLLIFML